MIKYALATATNKGGVTYWTGKYRSGPVRRPCTNVSKDEAKTFSSAARAYYAGTINKKLGLFRAVRLYSDVNSDGFISHWWLPIED